MKSKKEILEVGKCLDCGKLLVGEELEKHTKNHLVKIINVRLKDKKDTNKICLGCAYINTKGLCWARQGKADYGASGCDYRPNREE
jgi:hypothetical protein